MPDQDSSSEGEVRDQEQGHFAKQRDGSHPVRSEERDQRRRRSNSPRESRRQETSRSPSRPERRRSRSRSPNRQQRRSRSPRRRSEGHRKKEGGFRWKERRRPEEEDEHRNKESRLERGYQSHYRPNQRPDPTSVPDDRPATKDEKASLPKPKKSDKPKKKKVVVEEPMITVSVNDRLGTKAAIKCFGSDPLPLFKAQVAARIGRRPHEILLKRQGERALTGNRTLDDYLVSDGVQLDLEVDTGD